MPKKRPATVADGPLVPPDGVSNIIKHILILGSVWVQVTQCINNSRWCWKAYGYVFAVKLSFFLFVCLFVIVGLFRVAKNSHLLNINFTTYTVVIRVQYFIHYALH